MATAGNGAAPYEGEGAGGKFRNKPIRRRAQATPYDRPSTAIRNNNSSLFTKLMDPASRLLYAGAHRLFGAFRKRLPSPPPQAPPETNKEPKNGPHETGPSDCTGVSEPSTDHGGNSASISATTEILELEQILKLKTFTRSEIERLTELLHSRTIESPSDDDVEGDGAKLPSTTHPLRLEASTSGLLNKHGDERDNFQAAGLTPALDDVDERDGAKLPSTSHPLRLEASTSGLLNKHGNDRHNFKAAVSTPVVSSRVLEEDVASPAELAKAYMGTRPTKLSPSTLGLSSQALRQDSALLKNRTVFPKTPIVSSAPKTAGGFRGLENGFTTPRSRGRSAMYSMARTPFSRGPSTFSQKGINSDYGHGVASPSPASSQSAWEHEGPFGSNKTALKRRSSVLDDDIGSRGPIRSIRQKANLLSQGSYLSKHRSEFGLSALQQSGITSQKLLLMSGPEPKLSKVVEENGETSVRSSGYASVPTKSTQMATKILQQLERLSPKEKSSGSRLATTSEKSPTKLTSNMLQGQALRSLEKMDSPQDSQKSEGQHHAWLPDARESTSHGKDKAEEKGQRKFAIPRNMLTSMNENSPVPGKESASVLTTDSTLKLPAEPPQKKRAFQMSACEGSSEQDDDIRSNGHVSIPLGENKKPETSFVKNNDVTTEALPEVVQTPAPPAVSRTSIPEVAKISALPEFKKSEDAISPPKTGFGPLGGSAVSSEQKVGFNFPTSLPSSNVTQSVAHFQSTSIVDQVSPQKESNAFLSFGTSDKSAEKVPISLFSANGPSGFKPTADSDPIPPSTSSVFNSAAKNGRGQFSMFNKDDNGNGQKSAVNIFGKSDPLSSTPTSTSGIFSFGITKNSSTTNGTPASNPAIFSSSPPFPDSGTNTNELSNNSSSHVHSSSDTVTFGSTTTTTSAGSSVFSGSAPTPIFSSGPAVASSTFASVAPTLVTESLGTNVTKDKEPKSNHTSSSPFASTSFASLSSGSSIFGFGSSAATSTTNNKSQESFFSGSQANAQASTAVTQAAPFKFGAPTPSMVSGTAGFSSPTPGNSLFGSSTPALSSGPSFGLSSAVVSSETKSVGTTSGLSSTLSIFGNASQPPKSFAFGSTSSSPSAAFSFRASSTSTPPPGNSPAAFSFGASSTSTPLDGSSPVAFSFGASTSTPPASNSPAAFSFGASSTSTPLSSNSPAAFSFGASSASMPLASNSPAAFSFGASSASMPLASNSPAAFSFGASSTSMPLASSSPIMFGSSNTGASTGSSMFSLTAAGATNSSFSAPSQAQSVFGNSTPVFGAVTASPTNNDQMMAEDSMQAPTSSVPAFGQAPTGAPGFTFGSAIPTPPAPSFQFGGQTNQAQPQNPFQASGSAEFNAGGSFSLGTGGGDKSGRRIVRVKSKNKRK